MGKFAGILDVIIGGAEIAAGILITVGTFGGGAPLGAMLIASGAGMVMTGVGTLLSGDPVNGLATTTRNSVAPWKVCYGRCAVGGTVVYIHTWGDKNQMLDMVVVLACHPCESIDEVLFDQQRVQIDTNAIPTSAAAGYAISAPATGSGTSFTPTQSKFPDAHGNQPPTSIVRDTHGVVTVTLPGNIPYLTAGDQISISNVPGDRTLNGVFQVAEIISQTFGTPGAITFTYLCGGEPASVLGAGQVETRWPDYGRNVYVEYMLGDQTLGETFVGMTAGTPWQGTGKLCTPLSPQQAGSSQDGNYPNPWTNYCSLQGKTAVFIRLQYEQKRFPQGMPQISFHIHGKKDILDPRTTNANITLAVGNGGSGYDINQVLDVHQEGGSGLRLDITGVDSDGAVTDVVVNADGTGYSPANGLATTGGSGTGCTINMLYPKTYAYTENAALCIADYLNQGDPTDSRNRNPWGYKAAYGTEIPLQQLIDAANVCDESVERVIGGTEPRYACNGQFELTTKRGEVLQNLLTSCAGRLTYYNGQFIIHPAKWVTPLTPSVEFQSIAAGPMKWHPTVSIKDLYNGCKGTYISPENKWQSTDVPPYAQDSEHGYDPENLLAEYGGDINLADDGGDRRWLDVQLPFTISSNAAQRLCKIELLRRRHQGTGTFICNMGGYKYVPMDVITADIPFFGWDEKELEVAAVRLRSEKQGTDSGQDVYVLATEVDVQECDSSTYQWSTEEELSPQGFIQSNFPKNSIRELVCYPWSPGYVSPLYGDAIPGPASFGTQPIYGLDAQGLATAALTIKGTPPINKLDLEISGPYIKASVSDTGGNIVSGDYVVALSAWNEGDSKHSNSEYLDFATVSVVGTNFGTITVDIDWASGNDGGDLYIAKWEPDNGYVFHHNQIVEPGATTATITVFDQSTAGGVDPIFDHFAVTYQQEVHGGPFAAQVQDLTSNTITLAVNVGDGFGLITENQWTGYILSLLAKVDATLEVPILNMPVLSNTASDETTGLYTVTIGPNRVGDQLADLTTLLEKGDLLVMRHNATFTANSFSDPNIANGYYLTGATGVEAGHVAVVLSGADTGDVQTISDVGQDENGNYTIFNLAGSWKTTPATGDVVVICLPPQSSEITSSRMSVKNSSMTGTMMTPDIQNLGGRTWLVRVRTEDKKGSYCLDSLAPLRELYFFGSQGTRTITTDTTMLPTDSLISAYAQTGNITYTLLPFNLIPNQLLMISKIDATANTVTIITDPETPDDGFDDGTTSHVLVAFGDSFTIRIHGVG